MIGLILATCLSAHNCYWDIVEAKQEWVNIEQCVNDIPFVMIDLKISLTKEQALFCDELKEEGK